MIVVWLVCILWCLYTIYVKQRRESQRHKLPPCYPGAVPFIGHSHLVLLWSNDIYGFVHDMAEFCLSKGGVTYGYFAGDIYYAVCDPEDALTVCNTVTQKHELYKFGSPILGRGLLTGSGTYYKHHRKLLAPAFSSTVVHGFLGIFNDQYKQLVQVMDDFVGQDLYDPITLFRNFTLRISCMTVFGDSDGKDSQFLNTYIGTIDNLLELLLERLMKVWLHNDAIFNLTSLKKKQDRLTKILNDISDKAIHRKRAEIKNKRHLDNLHQSENRQKSFIEMLIEIAENETLNDDEIREELTTAVIASFETTSLNLICALVFIGSYWDIQEKLYQELYMHKLVLDELKKSIFLLSLVAALRLVLRFSIGLNAPRARAPFMRTLAMFVKIMNRSFPRVMQVVGDRDVEVRDINRLVYLSAVIKECLRLVPPVPLLARYVDKDVKLKNYTLRAGSQVICITEGIHKNKNYWGPDVDEFRPERWLDNDKHKLESLNYAFSIGKRSCLGRKYAMTSIAVALVYMIRKFRFTADHTKMKFKLNIVARPISGHEIIIQRRN